MVLAGLTTVTLDVEKWSLVKVIQAHPLRMCGAQRSFGFARPRIVLGLEIGSCAVGGAKYHGQFRKR